MAILFLGFLVFQRTVPNNPVQVEETINPQENITIENCEQQEIKNLIDNEYLRPEELAVSFYSKPSENLVNELANKYNLEVLVVYNDPAVVYKVSEENAPGVKCQLQQEPEVDRVVFIENRPVY